MDLGLVTGIIGWLIMMPDDSVMHLGHAEEPKVHIFPLVKSGLQFLPSWEKHVLAVSHHLLPFVFIYKLTLWILGPSITHDAHPTLCHHEQILFFEFESFFISGVSR